MSNDEARPTVFSKQIQSVFGIKHSTVSRWGSIGLLKPITGALSYEYYVDDLDQLLRDSTVDPKSKARSFLNLCNRPGQTIISSSQAARRLHCTTRMAQLLAKNGELEAYKIAKAYYIVADSVTLLVQKIELTKATSITRTAAEVYLRCSGLRIQRYISDGDLVSVDPTFADRHARVTLDSIADLLEAQVHGQTITEWVTKIQRYPVTWSKERVVRRYGNTPTLDRLITENVLPHIKTDVGRYSFWERDLHILAEQTILDAMQV